MESDFTALSIKKQICPEVIVSFPTLVGYSYRAYGSLRQKGTGRRKLMITVESIHQEFAQRRSSEEFAWAERLSFHAAGYDKYKSDECYPA